MVSLCLAFFGNRIPLQSVDNQWMDFFKENFYIVPKKEAEHEKANYSNKSIGHFFDVPHGDIPGGIRPGRSR